jgi:hypothetical protein
MNEFIKKYQEEILIGLGVLLFGLVVGSYVWGVTLLVSDFNDAGALPPKNGGSVSFDIVGAQKLGLPNVNP